MNVKTTAFAALAASCILCSCGMTFLDASNVSRAKDSVPPVISLSSPADGFQCANIVEARGTVSDLADGTAVGKVESLSYAIPGSTVQGTAAVAADGSFVFQFETTTLGTAFVLTLTARDWNGNAGSASVSLQKTAGNSIPSFAAEASNKQVGLTWESVPNTVDYTLYYSDNGSLPSETVGTSVQNVQSPYSLTCENGKLYTFRLQANAPEGSTGSLSDYVKTIPLSEMTLVPRAYGKRGKIALEWNGIDATDEFTVFRRVGEAGTFDEFRTTTGTSFTDTTAQNGQSYYYKVRPSDHCGTLSRAAAAQTDGFETSPSIVQSSPLTLRKVKDVFIDGNYLYGSSLTTGLSIYKASDPYALVLCGIAAAGKPVYQTIVDGNYAYCAAGADGLYIYDVSNPAAPTSAGSYDADDIVCVRGIAKSGDYVLLSDFSSTNTGGNNGWEASYNCSVKVIDVSTPEAPILERTITLDAATLIDYGTISEDNTVVEIAVSGDYAFIGERGAGLRIVDWKNPTVAASVFPPDLSNNSAAYAKGIAVLGNYVYAAVDYFGIMVVDISDPLNPNVVRYDDYGANGRTRDVAVVGKWLLTANLDLGVQIFDASDPAAPTVLRNIPIDYPFQLSADGPIAYVFNGLSYYGTENISIVDLNMPIGIMEKSVIATEGTCYDVAAAGPYAYVADGTAGLRVFDMSDPAAPVPTAALPASGFRANKIKIAGELAFVLFDSANISSAVQKMNIYNLTEPSSPKLLSTIGDDGDLSYARGLAVSGGYLYLTNYAKGLQVFDINDPTAPYSVNTVDASAAINDIAISGNYAYVADETLGAVAYDISDPLKTYYAMAVSMSECLNLCTNGTGLFSSNVFSDSTLSDISDPEDPTLIATVTNTSAVLGRGVAATGNYAFFSYTGNEGDMMFKIRIVDIGKLSSPRMIADIDTVPVSDSYVTNGLAVEGPVLYCAMGDGLRVYKLRP